MDNIIQTLIEILSVTDPDIAELLSLSTHNLNESSSYGSRLFSTLSTFEIISPPRQTAQLNTLTAEQKQKIRNAVLLIYPLMDNSPEITEIIFTANASYSKDVEFVQFIDEKQLINDISVALNLLERKPPKFWTDYKSDKNTKLLEDDYRSEFFRMLGMKYQVSSEEESKIGRTDLTLKSTSINRKIFEFKVWGRNDYLETSHQLLSYLTEIDDSGFIIMGNSRKTQNVNLKEYKNVIECDEYINDSLKIKQTNHGIEYYEADYSYNGNKKKIFHFILNLK